MNKVVVNDSGGSSATTDFSFQVNGGDITAFEADGQNNLTLAAGTYSVTEVAATGYTTTYENCTDVVLDPGGEATCTITNNDNAPSDDDTPPPPEEGRTGGGGGRAACRDGTVYDRITRRCEPVGQVLGAATSTPPTLGVSCGLYMDQHLRMGSTKNSPEQVMKLQQFLIKYDFGRFTPTGVFGPATLAAVEAFQLANKESILYPWGITAPTGLAYLTTLRKLNMIECPGLMIPQPELVPWNMNPNAQ